MVIAIDFDGTVVDHKYPEIGDLKPGAVNAMKAFHKAGHKIIIWTCRQGAHEREVRMFLTQNNIPFDSINMPIAGFDLATRKIYADVYIDDKGIRYSENWDEIRELIVGS